MKTLNIKRCLSASILLTALVAPAAWATQGAVIANITRTLVDSDSYGGCMVDLTVDPASVLPNCAGWWVSFSCTGDFTNAVTAYRMLDQAQLAMTTGKQVFVVFDDARLHNGYCFASRIDVIQ